MNGNKKSQIWDFDYIGSSAELVLEKLSTSLKGLSDLEASDRLQAYGYNEPARKKKRTIFLEILLKFINPLVIVLVVIAAFSLFFGEKIEALLVMLMAIMSVLLSFTQNLS